MYFSLFALGAILEVCFQALLTLWYSFSWRSMLLCTEMYVTVMEIHASVIEDKRMLRRYVIEIRFCYGVLERYASALRKAHYGDVFLVLEREERWE